MKVKTRELLNEYGDPNTFFFIPFLIGVSSIYLSLFVIFIDFVFWDFKGLSGAIRGLLVGTVLLLIGKIESIKF